MPPGEGPTVATQQAQAHQASRRSSLEHLAVPDAPKRAAASHAPACRAGTPIPLSEVAKHNTKEDAWIAVGGRVYNITSFITNHPGWDCACAISTVIAILRCLGTDCTEEFNAIHTPAGHRQLRAYYIGDLEE